MLTMTQPFDAIPSTFFGGRGEVLPNVRQRWKYSDPKMIGKHFEGIQRERNTVS
jgi:hypothetical protein